MPELPWPTELDDADRLLDVVGSFWADTYAGNKLVSDLLYAKAQKQKQAHLDLLELVASISRFTVPVYHNETWTPLTLLESELNAPNVPTFDGTYPFNGTINFDTPVAGALYAWPAPGGLVSAQVIVDRISSATATYTAGTDVFVQNGGVWFRENPFTSPLLSPVEVFEDGAIVDRSVTLWIYRGEFDQQHIYNQFGYVLGLKLESSEAYRNYVNAVYDGLVEGTSARCVEELMSAVCDVPLARETETVEHILTDTDQRWVVTDKNAYGFSLEANVIVAVGDVLSAGDPMTDALRFYDFGRGEVPDDLTALALGRGLLSGAFFRELTFENEAKTLVVEEDVDGYTRVEFEIHGWPSDVEKFWDDVHAAGVAADATLAMRLDTRTNKVGQPTAIALPTTVNPLEFLIANVLRGNAFAIVVRPEAFGPHAVGLHAARALRKLVPPQTLCLLVVRWEYSDDVVTMDGPGDEETAGFSEELDTFDADLVEESLLPADYVSEDVRFYQVEGYCS